MARVSIYVVRHAHAHPREGWGGSDRHRPLTERGVKEAEALTRRFGDRVGYHYYNDQDGGIFWSNDPNMTIGQMIRSIGLMESDANVERVRHFDDRARGGPPAARGSPPAV